VTRPPDPPVPDDDPGPLVRPFALTRGRAGKGLRDLDIFTLVATAVGDDIPDELDREYREILALCRDRPQSIAEIAARRGVLVSAAKVLVGDLIAAGYVSFRPPLEHGHDPEFLRTILAGLRRI
jgi:hypothetical protein